MFARSLALGALMLVGVAGISAAQSATAPQKADSGFHRRGPRAGGEMRGREFGRDLNLTDAQKAQIKTIREKYKPQNEAARTQAKPFMEAAKAARQKGDTAAFRSNIEKARQVGQSVRTQETAEIRNVLTPEQRAKFDAKVAQRGAKGVHKGWGRKAPAKS
jgi:protein CpxP